MRLEKSEQCLKRTSPATNIIGPISTFSSLIEIFQMMVICVHSRTKLHTFLPLFAIERSMISANSQGELTGIFSIVCELFLIRIVRFSQIWFKKQICSVAWPGLTESIPWIQIVLKHLYHRDDALKVRNRDQGQRSKAV